MSRIPPSLVPAVVLAVALALLPVPARAEVEQTKTLSLRDVLARLAGSVPEGADPIRVRLTFADPEGRRLEDVRVSLRDGKSGDEERIDPAGPGTFEFDLTRRMVRRDGSVVFRVEDYRGLVYTDVSPAEGSSAESAPTAAVSIDGLATVADDSGDLVVHFAAGDDEVVAREVLDLLVRARGRIVERIGSASPCAVAIVRGEGPVRVSERGLWAWAPDRETEDRFASDLLRDWIGRSVSDRVFLRGDSLNRWIVEGLVDWTVFEVLVDLGRGDAAADEVERRIAEGVEPLASRSPATWDLNDFQWDRARGFVIGEGSSAPDGSSSGAAMSQAFWAKLVRQHGESLPVRFLAAAADLRDSQRKNRRLVETIGELAGHDYRLEVQSFAVAEARAFLEAFVRRARSAS